MIRVLIIDKTAGLDSSHERHQELGRRPGVDLHVLGPEHWIENGREVIWRSHPDASYTSHSGKVFWKDYYARTGYYSGLMRAIARARPHIIQLLEEPWSISALQTLLTAGAIAHSARLLFYTWENIYRPWIYPAKASPFYRLIDKTLHARSTAAVCATEGARNVLLRKGYTKPTRVISYGIPSYFFAEPAGPRQKNESFTIGYVGRLIYMKGTDLLLRALAGLPDCRLILAGGGDTERWKKDAERLQIQDRIEWIPTVSERRVVDVLRRMDLFVLPSRTMEGWQEQLGRAIIEAMAVGTPVIGSSSGAIPEVTGDAGLIFQENSIEDLTAKIKYLRGRPAECERLRQKGIIRSRGLYTWPRFADQITEFYQSLMGQSA